MKYNIENGVSYASGKNIGKQVKRERYANMIGYDFGGYVYEGAAYTEEGRQYIFRNNETKLITKGSGNMLISLIFRIENNQQIKYLFLILIAKWESITVKVKYIGTSNKYFTNGEIYNVESIDADGDYFIIDNTGFLMNEYKGKFEIVNKFRTEE